jgi:hypothetical protein
MADCAAMGWGAATVCGNSGFESSAFLAPLLIIVGVALIYIAFRKGGGKNGTD